ncbi:Serine/threonine-protein kinase ulk4 [Bulinus truncatus]|nr:Serine/threonine-protein kinase ulk4 [Bulinus truncatus]
MIFPLQSVDVCGCTTLEKDGRLEWYIWNNPRNATGWETSLRPLHVQVYETLLGSLPSKDCNSLIRYTGDCYSKILKSFEPKKQKIVLRVIKRLISTNSLHVESMKKSGDGLAKTIQSLANTASSHADIALSTVAAEILKMTGHLS